MHQYLNRTYWRLPLIHLCIALLLWLSVINSVNAASTDLPDLGDSSAATLSAEEDYRLGQAFMRNLRQQVKIIDDPALNAYINSLGYRLLAGADTTLPFNFFIVDDPGINAFAGPGGHIGINSGLILAAESEGELAAVLAHEIAHVTQRHLARAFQKATTVQLQTAAAILAAILLGSPQISSAMVTTAAAGNIQQQLNFTRSHEQEADRVGIEILVNAGYQANHMPGFFYRLQESYRYMESNLPELLRTHPVTPSRIADSQNRARQYPKNKEDTSPGFPFIQAKLRVMGAQGTQHRQTDLEARLSAGNTPLSVAEQYEYAHYQLNLGQYADAERYSRVLLAADPESVAFIALQAQIELEQGKDTAAIQRLEKALLLFPNHPQLTVQYSQALFAADRAGKAADMMRELIQKQAQFALPSFHLQLAKYESAAGHEDKALLALAEYYYLLGQTRTAMDQVQKALDITPRENTFQYERINAQLTRLKEEALAEQQGELAPNK